MMQLAHLTKLGRAAFAAGEVGFDVARVAGIELAVDQRVQHQSGFVAVHCVFSSAASQAARSSRRPRASRDITVPIGAPTMSAISRYDRSLTSRSTNTSRNASGRSDSMARI